MREVKRLNNYWYYHPSYEQGMELINNSEGFQCVHLPHTNKELPYNYFDEKDFQFISCYKRFFMADSKNKDKIAVLRFEGVMNYAKVYVNGNFVGEHKGGYTPFQLDIAKYLNWDEENLLTVVVDSTERSDTPPFGGQIDYLTYGGIYREVSLIFLDKLYIENVHFITDNIFKNEKSIHAKTYIKNNYDTSVNANIIFTLKDKNNQIVFKEEKSIAIDKETNELDLDYNNIKGIQLWDIDNPNLYYASLTIKTDCSEDTFTSTIGFRHCEFTKEGFFLNNKRIKIRGLNRHQSYPYVGYAMPKRVQEKDVEILKNELHLNLVRTSHYPQSIHFLNKCDELGLLVFEEIPGWQHIGDETWKEVAIENVREMIERDWNHPSIILWGVRINESQDDDTFYKRTNELAHSLDSTRQTGGVRYIENSKLLEDVYTMNDFIHEGGEKVLREQKKVTGLKEDVPYLVTEYNGHMYPTKIFDQEERQMEHVLRHLRVQNASYSMDNISGAIGWCAFDYNTHKDFGSGDRICYHGIMDMFRQPKFASYVYKSQVSPQVEPVLMPVTYWARGERSIGGVLPLVILTNCDYIEFQFGNLLKKRIYPSKDKFKHLPYAPIIIDTTVVSTSEVGEWGMLWEDCHIFGYVQDKMVIEKHMSKEPVPTTLQVVADDYTLNSNEKDATRVTVKILDQCNNPLPFIEDILTIKIDGVARLLGPSMITFKGGAASFWVETINEVGDINIQLETITLGKKDISITVK